MKRLATTLWSSLAVGGVLLSSFALHAEGPQSGESTRPASPLSPEGSYFENVTFKSLLLAGKTGGPPAPEPVPEPIPVPADSSQSSPVDEGVAYCPTCQYGNEGEVYYGGFGGHHYRPGRGAKLLHQIFDWTNPHGMCVHSPDYGFRPPVKQPIYRRPVAYSQWYPQEWSGQQAGNQQQGQYHQAQYQQGQYQQAQYQQSPYQPHSVYWPTDTTQLGYYYQRTPHWHPYANMIPGPPQPQVWHQYPAPSCQPGHRPFQILGTAERVAPYGSAQGPVYEGPMGPPIQSLPEPTQAPADLVPPMEAALQPTGSPSLLPLNR